MWCRKCIPMMVFVALAVAAIGFLSSADAATLTWSDNSTNEAGFTVERAPVPCVPVPAAFTEIGRVAANVKTYVDSGAAPNSGTKWCYRVRAFNYKFTGDLESAQYSGYTNLAGIDYPLPQVDAAPSQLGATP